MSIPSDLELPRASCYSLLHHTVCRLGSCCGGGHWSSAKCPTVVYMLHQWGLSGAGHDLSPLKIWTDELRWTFHFCIPQTGLPTVAALLQMCRGASLSSIKSSERRRHACLCFEKDQKHVQILVFSFAQFSPPFRRCDSCPQPSVTGLRIASCRPQGCYRLCW